MKKVLALILVLSMVAVMFVGCGKQETKVETPSATPAPSSSGDSGEKPADNSQKTIAIMMHSVADDFIYTVLKAAEKHAQELGYKTISHDAAHDAALQASTVSDFIQQGVDAVFLCPQDAAALSDSVIELNNAGIPVVLVDRGVNEGKYVALCASDNYAFGYQGAVQIVEMAKKFGVAKEDLKILELQGDLASTSGLDRSKGFQDACKELGLTIVSSLPTYWETDVAYNATLDGLQAHPEINAIFAASDGVMGDAITSALEQLGRLYPAGDPKHVIITAVDGTPGVIEHIRKGNIDVTCAQPAIEMANTAIDKLDEALKGKIALDACEDVSLAPVIGTKENIDSKELWANQDM